MKKYTCPYCGKDVCGHFKKAFAGGLNSKGIACPHCSRRLVNGKGSTIANAVIMLICAAVEIYIYTHFQYTFFLMGVALVFFFLLCRLYDAFFGELVPTERTDIF